MVVREETGLREALAETMANQLAPEAAQADREAQAGSSFLSTLR